MHLIWSGRTADRAVRGRSESTQEQTSVNLRRLARTLRQIADQIEQIEINPVPRRMRFGTKLDKVVRRITRPRGATRQKILATTGWKTISVRAVANKAGLQLSKERSRNGEWRYVARPPRRAA